MNWNEKCLLELTHHNMFEDTDHRLRFRDLTGCYYKAPFFSRGLCKCMYLASFDQTHFEEILDALNELTIDGAKTPKPMSERGAVLADQSDGPDKEIYCLSNSFLNNTHYTLPDLTLLDPDVAHIIRRSLLASQYIDDLPDPKA